MSRGSLENGTLAIEGNPCVPGSYADIGNWFAQDYRTDIAWRMFDIGRALGGCVPGDAFDHTTPPMMAWACQLTKLNHPLRFWSQTAKRTWKFALKPGLQVTLMLEIQIAKEHYQNPDT